MSISAHSQLRMEKNHRFSWPLVVFKKQSSLMRKPWLRYNDVPVQGIPYHMKRYGSIVSIVGDSTFAWEGSRKQSSSFERHSLIFIHEGESIRCLRKMHLKKLSNGA